MNKFFDRFKPVCDREKFNETDCGRINCDCIKLCRMLPNMNKFIKKEHKRLYENFDLAMECIEKITIIAKNQQNYEICKPIEEFFKVYTNV